jgi:hypothetical protein
MNEFFLPELAEKLPTLLGLKSWFEMLALKMLASKMLASKMLALKGRGF